MPSVTAVAILTLALGMGATTTMVSVVTAILLRPLPYPDSDRLVRIVDTSDNRARAARSLATVNDDELEMLRSNATTLSAIGVFPGTALWLTTTHSANQLIGTRVSPGVLPTLGARPLVGRLFEAREEVPGAAPVVILAYATWLRFFGGDPQVLGRQLTLDGRAFSVVGVMARGFEFPFVQNQFWIPLGVSILTSGASQRFAPIARVKQGVPLRAAALEVSILLDRFRGNIPPDAEPDPTVPPSFDVVRMQDEIVAPVREALLVLAGAVGFVLLVACANVANLLIARGAARSRETAVRYALGASRGRLIRQFLAESLVLAVFGGLAGIGLAAGCIRLVRAVGVGLGRRDLTEGVSIPRLDEVHIDLSTLFFTLGLSILTSIACGLLPALVQSRREAGALRGDGGADRQADRIFTSSQTHSAIVVAEIGGAMALAVAGGLLIHSFAKLTNVDAGFQRADVVTFQVSRGRYAQHEQWHLRNSSWRVLCLCQACVRWDTPMISRLCSASVACL